MGISYQEFVTHCLKILQQCFNLFNWYKIRFISGQQYCSQIIMDFLKFIQYNFYEVTYIMIDCFMIIHFCNCWKYSLDYLIYYLLAWKLLSTVIL